MTRPRWLQVRVSDDDLARLDAVRGDVSRSEWVRRAIGQARDAAIDGLFDEMAELQRLPGYSEGYVVWRPLDVTILRRDAYSVVMLTDEHKVAIFTGSEPVGGFDVVRSVPEWWADLTRCLTPTTRR
jgi:hypothetical protein